MKTIYYKDELNDEFSEAKITPRKIDEKYKYNHSIIWEFFSYVIQNIISMPIKTLYLKIKFHHKYIGKEKLKNIKTGCYIYANHTQPFADSFIPSVAIYPKRNFLIVNPENVSIKPWGWLIELLGAIPVPGNTKSARNFLERIKNRIDKNYSISIYPEAHIWPYYIGIRNFKDVSFKYPVEHNVPSFSVTNTYIKRKDKNKNKTKHKNKENEKVNMITYIDGPFFPDQNLSKKEAQKKLRNEIYNKMLERSKNSNIEIIRYIKEEDKE